MKIRVAARGVQAVKRSLPSLVEGCVLTLTLLVSQALAAQQRDRIYRKTQLVAARVKAELWADATASFGFSSHGSWLGKLGRG